MRASRGALILNTDDDCYVSPDWLETGIELLSGNPLQIIGGRIDLHDVTDRSVTVKFETEPASLTHVGDLLGFLHGCNMIFGRCVIERIGGFDVILGPGSRCKAADDTDLVYRALKHGITVSYRPELRLAHNHGRKQIAEETKLVAGYNLSVGAMAFKHLLRGDIQPVKLLYWRLRSEVKGKRRERLRHYARGFWAYARSCINQDYSRLGS